MDEKKRTHGPQRYQQASSLKFDSYEEAVSFKESILAASKATEAGPLKIRKRGDGTFDVVSFKPIEKKAEEPKKAS